LAEKRAIQDLSAAQAHKHRARTPPKQTLLNGSLFGQVSDASSAVAPGATVRLTHRETNQQRVTATNVSGGYSFPTLPGGTYDIVISKEGFQTFTVQSVAVAVGQVGSRGRRLARRRRLGDSLGDRRIRRFYRPIAPEVRSEVTAKQLENLPTPLGRSYENLLITVPGLSPPSNQHSVAVIRRAA